MAKSSIHIDSAKVNFLAHNTRSKKTVNSIFDDEENYYSCDFDSAVKLYREELAKRSAKYTERTGQKLQAKTVTMMSSVVNLNQHHDEHDLRKIVDHLEQTLDTKVINYAIHRDEGHRNDKGQPVKNYHAHIVFMGLDSEGRSVRKKLTKGYLSKLQDKTAQLLGMERGTNYAKQRKPRPKRLDTYEYKAAAEKLEKQKKSIFKKANKIIGADQAKIKDVTEEANRLRDELKKEKAKRAQYAELEALTKKLKEQARAKELSIEELKDAMQKMQDQLMQQIKQNQKLKDENERANREIDRRDRADARRSEDLARASADRTRSYQNLVADLVASADGHHQAVIEAAEAEQAERETYTIAGAVAASITQPVIEIERSINEVERQLTLRRLRFITTRQEILLGEMGELIEKLENTRKQNKALKAQNEALSIADSQKTAQIVDLEARNEDLRQELEAERQREPELIESILCVADHAGVANPAQIFELIEKEVTKHIEPVVIRVEENMHRYDPVVVAYQAHENYSVYKCKKPSEVEQERIQSETGIEADLISPGLSDLLERTAEKVSEAWQKLRDYLSGVKQQKQMEQEQQGRRSRNRKPF